MLDLHRRAAEIPAERWATARLAGPHDVGAVSGLSTSLCVSASTPRPAEAWALVRHLSSPASELRYQTMIGNLPARLSAWTSPQLRAPILAPFKAQMRFPATAPKVIEWERIKLEIQFAAERVVRNVQTIPQALAGLDTRVDQLLAKRRALVEAGTPRMTRQERAAWLFSGPVLAIIALVFVLPTALAMALSVTDYSIYALADWANLRFVGLGNFIDLFSTPLFWRAIGNTALFALLGVPIAIGASLAVALLLNDATVRWKPLWRVLLFAPYVTSIVATAVVWRFLFNERSGLINRALATVGAAPVDWLGNPHTSIPAILIFVTWKIFGYNMIVFTAALSAVPQDLMEAARLDGADRWGRFRHVTLPAIGPTLLLAAVMSVAGFLQIFAEPYVMTLGGPAQSTTTILYFMFDEGFKWWNLGQASAVAFVLFLMILALTMIQTRIGRRYEWL
ncbi:ABC transporter permease subunit [Sphingomonas aerolata]|uniref:ABC transporter permease subunit n=1 Tax=Sphingomonas aerolata TaxID=185951 RepID=UPI002FE409B8